MFAYHVKDPERHGVVHFDAGQLEKLAHPMRKTEYGAYLNGLIGEVHNIGGRSEFENIELARMLCAIVDNRLRSTPRISLQAGLGATVGWYMERVDKLKAGWQRTALAL